MTTSPTQLFPFMPSAAPSSAATSSAARRPGMLIGDQERDITCQALAQHFAAGRLTVDELDARVNAAMAARTNVELHLITADLPQPHSPSLQAAPVPHPTPTPPGIQLLAHGIGIVTTLAAIGCTLLLLFATGVSSGSVAVAAWLAAFGASVSVAGSIYYGRRLFRRPSADHAAVDRPAGS